MTAPPGVERPRRTQGLSVTADGRVVPSVRRRLASRMPPDRGTGWVATLAVTALAGFLRFWHLGTPRVFAFDETYYAKDAWSLWHHGYARNWVEDANDKILAGAPVGEQQTGAVSFVVHPELGKWLIGAGEQLFGMDPFGWRVASAVVGTLMVLVMVRLARRLTGSTLLGCVAGLLLCVDGMHLVLSRMALLDVFAAFFLLCAVSCLVVDRDWGRLRMARMVPGGWRPTWTDWGPVRGLRWRPWRLSAGLMFGLAVSSKWTTLVPLAAFGVLVVCWDAGARRALGVRRAFLRAAVVDGLPAFGYLVVVAFVVYVASWTGWLLHHDAYEQALAVNSYGPYWGDYTKTQPGSWLGETLQALRSLANYHRDAWAFHTAGLDAATHSYQSDPLGWLVQQRPVSVAVDSGIEPGMLGCAAPPGSTCLRQVLLLGNPVVWWLGTLAAAYAVVTWVVRRDWRCGLVVVGVASTWLPWLGQGDRPIFVFYAVTTLPFLVLATTLLLGRVLGPDDATPNRRALGTAVAGTCVLLAVVAFAWFWPLYTHQLLTHADWLRRMWFRSWI